MRDPDALAGALAAALRELTERVTALRTLLAASRAAFAGARASALENTDREHQALTDRVHDGEQKVAVLRAELCAALGEPPAARLRSLLGKLASNAARGLGEAAGELRRALQVLRVETTVGQRLLDVTRRAQEGLHRAHVPGGSPQRYDRHARSVRVNRSGDIVQGTV